MSTRRSGPTQAERYAALCDALRGEADVTVGPSGGASPSGRRFGDSALHVGNRIFAMLASRERFAVKLPRQRVAELTASGDGAPLDFGGGRVMREWLTLSPESSLEWLPLAREAMAYVASGSTRRRRSAG
jgi:hypothetical protein